MVKTLVVFEGFLNFDRLKELFSKEQHSEVVVLKASSINNFDDELENYCNFLIPIDSANNPIVDMKRFSSVTFGKLPSSFKTRLVGTLLNSPGADRFQLLHFYLISSANRKSDELYEAIKKAVLEEKVVTARPWCENLLPYIEQPDHDEILFKSPEAHMIFVRDRFPKGSLHYLCLPTKRIDTWAHLTPSDIPLLLKMKSEADLFSKRIEILDDALNVETDKMVTFKFGFHVIPSMKQLHLHIVSDDFLDNPNLTVYQYNAFNSDFLVSIDAVIEELEAHGRIFMDQVRWDKYWNLLNAPLKCSYCEGRSFRTLERLRIHYKKAHVRNQN